jgi:hypothetical protein
MLPVLRDRPLLVVAWIDSELSILLDISPSSSEVERHLSSSAVNVCSSSAFGPFEIVLDVEIELEMSPSLGDTSNTFWDSVATVAIATSTSESFPGEISLYTFYQTRLMESWFCRILTTLKMMYRGRMSPEESH